LEVVLDGPAERNAIGESPWWLCKLLILWDIPDALIFQNVAELPDLLTKMRDK
jgi:hypothetical protein